jgi:hypothetical protein
MSVVDRNSNVIANAVATPKVLNQPAIGGASVLKEVAGLVTPAADDSQNAIHRFVRVPSNARISQVLLGAADATTAGAYNFGVYQTAENGGAVVDADLFGSAVDLANAADAVEGYMDITYESKEYTFAESIKPLWEVLGLSADPQRDYDIAGTISTTFNGGPTAVLLRVRYVQ